MVGLKADLGALILGILIAPHPRAKEMARSLMTVKDILLVGFFVEIGLSGFPTASGMVASLTLLLILPLKMFLYFLMFSRFRLRARTAFVTTMKLSNYSEFGLIVCTLAATSAQIDSQWLVVLAIAHYDDEVQALQDAVLIPLLISMVRQGLGLLPIHVIF